jgi:hypothetical protein
MSIAHSSRGLGKSFLISLIVVFMAALGVVIYSQTSNMDIRGRASTTTGSCVSAGGYCQSGVLPTCCSGLLCVVQSGIKIGKCQGQQCTPGAAQACVTFDGKAGYRLCESQGQLGECNTNICFPTGSTRPCTCQRAGYTCSQKCIRSDVLGLWSECGYEVPVIPAPHIQ